MYIITKYADIRIRNLNSYMHSYSYLQHQYSYLRPNPGGWRIFADNPHQFASLATNSLRGCWVTTH